MDIRQLSQDILSETEKIIVGKTTLVLLSVMVLS